jgi:nicotinate dehydrogenase subunit A
MIHLTVNGVQHALDIDPATPLLYALRNCTVRSSAAA